MSDLLTSHQIARLSGTSVSYVQIQRRNGTITAATAVHRRGPGGGNSIEYRFAPDAAEIVRASKATARERQRNSRTSKLATTARRICTRRPMPDGSARPCACHDLGCEPCLAYYRQTPGISGSGTGETELRGAGR